MNEASDLPRLTQGWVWTRLIDACQYIPTGVPAFEGKIEYYSTGSIGKDYCVPEGTYSFIKRPSRANRIAQEGDVLQARMRETNKALLIGNKFSGKLFSTGFFQVRPFDCSLGMAPYLYFYVQSLDFLRQRDTLATGSTQVALTDSAAQRIYFPLAPLKEQHRIVAKIEELCTGLDAGVEALKKIKTQLKRYRQSVLKHTFEGKLTAEWRQAHKHELEPASILLELIKQERHKTAKGKHKELPPLDTSNLPELPEGWVWSNFEELKKAEKNSIKAGPFGSSLKKESYASHGYKIYGQEQVIRQNPSYGNYYIGEEKYVELKSCVVKPGDILISLVGTIGKVLILPKDSEPGIINPRLIKLSLEERLVDNKYIKAYIESSAVRDLFTLASHGETMEILNLGILRTLPIPVPPPTEQHRIVEEIEHRFSIADEIEKTVDHSLKQAERLRHSILKRAFEGKLVPQNPSDESAEKLLERIREQRANQIAEKRVAISKVKRKQSTDGN